MRQRRFPFECGVFQGNETVEDCVGKNTSPIALRELYPWIQNVQKRQNELLAKLGEEEDEFEGIDDEGIDDTRFKVNDPELRLELYLKQLHRVMAETYLGLLAYDKHFMEHIMESPEIWSANVKGGHELYDLAERSHRTSCYRQDILRMRKPFYIFPSTRNAKPPGHKMHLAHDKQLRMKSIVIEADFLLLRMHAARMRRNYPLFFSYVGRTKDKFESYSNRMFPLKQNCLDAIYNMAGWAYTDTRNLTCLDDEAKERYLKHHLGICVGKLPRDCELAWVPTPNKKFALQTFRRRLSLASTALELAWLFHDLSKLLTEMHRYDMARFYAKKARDVSNEAGNVCWALNANHILIRIEVYQRNRNEAREAAQVASINAKRMGIDYLIDFYKRAIKLVDEVDFEAIDRSLDSISKREQLILNLMPDDLKTEVDFLFRSMAVVPARRRLSVMPGCKPINYKFNLSCKRNSILPAPPRDPAKEARAALLQQFAPSKKILGLMDFENLE